MNSLHLTANRLRHHLLEWGGGDQVVLLLHGFLEHAHVWELVAPRLAEAGLHVYALDWRGHGDSQWIGAGGYYHFADYLPDVHDLSALERYGRVIARCRASVAPNRSATFSPGANPLSD